MNSDYNSVIMGVWLVLGAQLLILSIAKFCFGTRKQLPLAFLCMVMSMWFLRKFFRGTWEEYYLLNIIMGGRKEVFLGPLVLIHLRMLTQRVGHQWVLKHMAVPIIVYLTYLIISTGFWEYYESIYEEFFQSYLAIIITSFWYYFYLGMLEFRRELRHKLIPKAYTRHLIFFRAFFVYYLSMPVLNLVRQLTGYENFQLINTRWFYLDVNGFYDYIYNPYFFLLSFVLFIYGLTETRYFKNLFLAQDIIVKEPVPEKVDKVEQLVREHFYEAKLFLDAELTLSLTAKTIGCSRKDFSDYLKERELSFTEFVNQLKVAEFKQLIVKEENQVYDMVSVAEKAGFRSKATFNRVFKQLEGITPRDYRKSLLEV
ncbi:MAG: helix-turn-helix transcriptional regulator [Roseivirga sp.]|nr:helix-turn-helix transcriptional regulator [Roseivirga sp.]